MTYQPQRFTAPDGTEMVVLRAEDWERLRAYAEDEEDVREATAIMARIEAGEGTMPGEVLNLMLDEGLSPLAAWRRHRGLSQAALAKEGGPEPGLGRPHRGGRRLRLARDAAQAGGGAGGAGLVAGGGAGCLVQRISSENWMLRLRERGGKDAHMSR
jgi:hypothetical protein